MRLDRLVAVLIDGKPEVHLAGSADDHDTLCGIDANDPEISHGGFVKLRRFDKVGCVSCYQIWKVARKVKLTDFSKEINDRHSNGGSEAA